MNETAVKPPTRDDLEKLALTNPIIASFFKSYYWDNWLTYEEMCIAMIQTLVVQNNAYKEMVSRHLKVCTHPMRMMDK